MTKKEFLNGIEAARQEILEHNDGVCICLMDYIKPIAFRDYCLKYKRFNSRRCVEHHTGYFLLCNNYEKTQRRRLRYLNDFKKHMIATRGYRRL